MTDGRRASSWRWGKRALSGGAAVGLVVVGVVWPQHRWYVLLAAIFGGSVGASELASRYRDEPLACLRRPAAMSYVCINAAVSAGTYGLLTSYAADIFPALAGDRLMTSIVAGFGAMAVLRSRFFILHSAQGEEISVGPDAVITTFLKIADSTVDRQRAGDRMNLIRDTFGTRRPSDEEVGRAAEFVKGSLAAFQGLSTDDKAMLTNTISQTVKDAGLPPDLKLQAIAYLILRVTGDDDFRQIMDDLKAWLGWRPEAPAGT